MRQRDSEDIDVHAFGVACEAIERRLEAADVFYIVGDPVLGRREYSIRLDRGVALIDVKQIDGQTVASVDGEVCARSRNASFVGQRAAQVALPDTRSSAGGGEG